MVVRSALERSGSGTSHTDSDAVVVAEGLSKEYGRPKLMLFPPVISLFHRGPFKRNKNSKDEEGSAGEDASASNDTTGAKAGPGEDGSASKRTASARRPAPAAARRYDREDDDLDDLEDFDDDDDDDDEVQATVPAGPREMFWALKDVSFRLGPGEALGVLGDQESGKSVLMRILGGQAFPTEGRVAVRDPVSPLAAMVTRALSKTLVTGSPQVVPSVVAGARLLGVPSKVTKQYKEEIEELAQPLEDEYGQLAPKALLRLGLATAVVLPSNLILIDDLTKLDEAFIEQIVERLRRRVEAGSSLVFASRMPDLVSSLCDEVIVLDEGKVIEHREAKGAVRAFESAQAKRGRTTRGAAGSAAGPSVGPGRHPSDGRELRVPEVVPAFNASASVHAATVRSSEGRSRRLDAAADDISVEIRFETAAPDVEAHCGISFLPRDGDGTGLRFELPEPLSFAKPGTYVLIARIPRGELSQGTYNLRADAQVARHDESGASVIARDAGAVRILGDQPDPAEPDEPPITHWDGHTLRRAEAEWSIQ